MSILSYSAFVYRAFMAAILSLSTLAMVVAADPYVGDWPTQGGDMGRSGSVSGSIATRRLQVAWEAPLPGIPLSPAVVGGRVYSTEYNGGVTCYDARTGALIWRRNLTSAFSVTPPTVAGGRVFFTRFYSDTSEAMALNAADGATIWSSPVLSQWESYGAPCVVGGRVFSGGGTLGGLYGFNQTTGAQLFFNAALPQVDGWMASAANGGLLTWIKGTLRQHNVTTGIVERSVVLDSNFPSYQKNIWAAVSAARVVVVSSIGVFSVDPITLATQWSALGTGFSGSSVIQGDSVFVASSTGIRRLAASTGALLASSPDLGGYLSYNSLVVADDAVVVSVSGSSYDSTSGSTWILDRSTLALRQRLPFGGAVVVADGALFVADQSPARLLRVDLLDATLDAQVNITVAKNGVPISAGATTSGDIDVTVSISNAIGQHVQVYGNFEVLQSMDHDEMIDTSPWVTTVKVDTRRFFDGENLLSAHVHPHNAHDARHTTDFSFATFLLKTANGKPAPSGDVLLPQFHSTGYPVVGANVVPPLGPGGWSRIRSDGELIDDGITYQIDKFFVPAGPIQIISHLGTSVLGRMRWHTSSPPVGDLQLIDGVDARPFMSVKPQLARIVYFFTDRVGRANYYTENILLPALTAADVQSAPLPLMHAHILNLHDGDHLIADDAAGFTAYVKVVNPLPHADRYHSLNLWIGNRSVAVVRMQPYIDAMPAGGTSCIIPVVIPAGEVGGLLAAHDAGENSRAFALWMDFTVGDLDNAQETANMPNGEHLHLNSIRLNSTPWTFGDPTVVITGPYEGESVGGQPLQLRYQKWGNMSGVSRALVSVDGAAAVTDVGFDGVMTLPVLTRGAHQIVVTLADSAGNPLLGMGASAMVNFVVPNRVPTGAGDGWRTAMGTTLIVPAVSGVLANDSDLDGDVLSASVVENPAHGALTLAANGSFTYQPQAGFVGVDRFSYRTSDGTMISATTVALVLVGCDGLTGTPGPWTTLGNGPSHTGFVSGSLSNRQPIQAWSYVPGDSGPLLHAVIADGRIHTGVSAYSAGMQALGIDLQNGGQIWRRDFANGNSLNPPTVDSGRVYLQRGNAGDTQLWSLDAATGAIVWQAPFGAQWARYLAPCVADGKIFINGGVHGGMYGFRQSDGAQLFFAQLQQYDGWTPTWNNGRLFTHVATHLRSHDPLTGASIGDVVLDPGQFGGYTALPPAVVADGRLLVRDDHGIYGLDETTLVRQWRVYQDGRFIAMPAVSDRLVYAPLSAGGLEVRSLDDGSLQRTAAFPEIVVGQPIICDDLVIFASETATRALDRATLQTRWTLPVGGLLSLGQNALCVTSTQPTVQMTCYKFSLSIAPMITSHPASATVTAGQTATFAVVASGTPPLTYQWKQGTTNVGINNATLTLANAQSANAGSYTCVVTNSAGTATSNVATLTVNAAGPATRTWTGLGANDLWSTSANWQGGVAPVAGDDLVFAGATRLTPSNDFAANTSFNSITFASGASAFTVGGNGITMAGNITNSSVNTQTIAVPMIVNVATATMTGSSNIILSGVISEIGGARAIAKTGTGTLTLSGANTYSGATTISAGKLVLQGTYATSSYSIAAGAVLELSVSTGTTNYATTMFTGAGTLRKTGAGIAVWPGTAATFALSTGSLIDVVAGTLVGGSYGNEVWTSNVSDLTVALGATFSGVEANVRVNKLNGAGSIQTGYSGAGYVAFTIGVNNGTGGNFSGAIINSYSAGSIEKIGTGTQILSGASAYTGTTTITAGTLVLNQTTSYASSVTTVNAPGILELTSTNGTVDNWRMNTILAGAGTINKTGSGWIQTFTNAHTFSGTLNVQAGTFGTSYLSSNWSGMTADVNISGGALLDARGQAITVGSLNGAGAVGTTWTSAATVNVGAGNKSGTLAGAISGNNSAATNIPTAPNAGVLSVTKLGTGTQTLSGANIYTGATTVSAGTLLVNGSTHASSAVAVNGGGALGGTGTVNGTTTVSGTGILAPGAVTGNAIGTLNTAAVTVTGGTYAVDLDGILPSSDKINATGTVSLGAGVAALTIANATNSSAGKIYTIVSAVNVSGMFSGMANGAIFTQAGRNFLITYTATAVTLTDNAVNSTNPPLYQVGLRAEFFDSTAGLSVIPNLSVLVPDVVRTDAQIAYASVGTAWAGLPSTMVDTFASRHSGWLKIDTAGTYTLFINSDDGSRVYLDGAFVIDNDGLHGMQERSVTLSLAAGFHQLRVEFFENTGGCGLEFSWSGPGIAKQLVPASALWQSPSSSVVGVPLPWIAADVGPVKVAGSANGNGVDFSITGSGAVDLGTTSSTNITDYTLCANEGQSFALPGICDVAYGANGVYVFRNNLSGTVVFNNATFPDPIPSVVKKGYYRLSGVQDAFQMVYRPLTANGEFIARVVSLENTNTAAKAGVMVRDSIASRSVNGFMAMTPTSGATFQSRTATGGATVSTLSAGTVAPYWVRVVRIGTTVTGWMSSDGITWTQVGAAVTLPLGATPIIGLGVIGGNNDLRALGIFDQVLFIPYAGG